MPDPQARGLAAGLLSLTQRVRRRAKVDPFGNPVLSMALSIGRRIGTGEITQTDLTLLVRDLRDAAFDDRAARLARYVGGVDPVASQAALTEIARQAARGPWEAFRAAVERIRFAAVFTAHPTFAVPPPVFAALAQTASGGGAAERFASHRPCKPSLEDEFDQANAAILRGRDAIDILHGALLDAAVASFPKRWTTVSPRPIVLASWVGYDTDGRTDIDWPQTLRFRLRMKQLQLQRLADQVAGAPALTDRIAQALAAVRAQIAACPDHPGPETTARFAQALIGLRDAAIQAPSMLLPLFADAIGQADSGHARQLAIARAGLVGHGLSLAHTHVRLNAAQVHNAVRLRLQFEEPPADPSRRRSLLAAINAALDRVEPIPVDFGAILIEQASATRLMMTVAQIVKHIDGETPVRFLIAETESGYTLLAALWLARLFGIERQVEISPLFETAQALEAGARVIEEALRSRHYRDYVAANGRIAIQFGYSDSGRYVGQLTATYLIERLRLKLAHALTRHGLQAVEIVLFDTHGESIGRGAHPGSLADRLAYLSPDHARHVFARAGIAVREECSFQGGDGYLPFGTADLALATIAGIARHAFAAPAPDSGLDADPVYEDADFAADFFTATGATMHELVEDPGYAALLGAFGPALLDPTGSRPPARQQEGGLSSGAIRHPRELRAILNNAILQQLGWFANTLHGLGTAASRQPEAFAEMRATSPRFARATQFSLHAMRHSDLDVLRATVTMLDPGTWFDRAAQARVPANRAAIAAVARALGQLSLWGPAQMLFRRIQADHLALRQAWPDAPGMADREMLLHALRLALIQRIWMLSVQIPDFSPRQGVTREGLNLLVLRLEIPAALRLLAEIFPHSPDPAAERDYAEPHAPRSPISYTREHAALFAPIGALFDLVREIGTAITHEIGAFG